MVKTRHIGIGTVNISKKARKNVLKVLLSNRLSAGKLTGRFEVQMAKLHGRRFAIFCNSGTSALQVAVGVLKEKYNWKNGDEVIVPAITFIATSNVVIQNNLKPVFVDVESEYFGIDPALIETKITSRTKAIMPVHLFGQSADMKPILRLAKKYKLRVIEDSAESMFVKYNGKPVGSLGDIACFSTYATHLITTGVGGLAMTNDSDLAVMIKSYFNHGRDSIYLSIDDDNNKSNEDLFKIVPRRFSFTHLGYSYRLTEMEAALGLDQLSNWKSIILNRQKNANYLTNGLLKWKKYIQLPEIRKDSEHAFMLYPILIINKNIKRQKLLEHLELVGVETRFLMPLLNQPIYKKIFGDIEKQYPVANFINDNGFIIGCHQDLTKSDLDYVIKVFDNYFLKL